MTARNKKPTASSTLSVSDVEAQSVLRMNEWISQVDQAERMSVGTWFGMPDEFKGWVFMRCGLRGVDRAEALAASLRRMGYVDAPKSVRSAGFETDGERGLYLMIPKQGYAHLQQRKRQGRRAVQSATSAFESTIGSINGLGAVDAQVRTKQTQIKADV